MVKYCLRQGADTSVLGVSLGPKVQGVRSKNGPFSALEWARRRGHTDVANAVEFEMTRPARETARALDQVAGVVEDLLLTAELALDVDVIPSPPCIFH